MVPKGKNILTFSTNLSGAPGVCGIRSGLFGPFRRSARVKTNKNKIKTRGAPSISGIRSGLFGAFLWSQGVKNNKKKKIFSTNLSWAPRGSWNSFGSFRSIPEVPKGKYKNACGPLDQWDSFGAVRCISVVPNCKIRSGLFGPFRWSPGVYIKTRGGPPIGGIRSGLFGAFRCSPGVTKIKNKYISTNLGESPRFGGFFGSFRSIPMVPWGNFCFLKTGGAPSFGAVWCNPVVPRGNKNKIFPQISWSAPGVHGICSSLFGLFRWSPKTRWALSSLPLGPPECTEQPRTIEGAPRVFKFVFTPGDRRNAPNSPELIEWAPRI